MSKAQTEKYNYYKLRKNRDGTIDVLAFGTYPENSVLAGQTMKVFMDTFDTEEEAKKVYPKAEGYCGYESVNTFDHLPGPDDFMSGGALPDDYDD